MLSDQEQYTRATEIMSAFFHLILSFFGAPFPTEWASKWALLTRLRAQLEKSLGTQAFQAAWERGTQLNMAAFSDELQALLDGQLKL
jgi:hypothetical protein